MIITCLSTILHSFLFMSFSPLGFSHEVFNETISIQEYICRISYFSPQGFFKEDAHIFYLKSYGFVIEQ